MKAPKLLGIVLAGGEGKRLLPLTEDRAKPAVPFGGHYRLIDFAISNLINSGLRQIVVLTQYKSHSLDRHISQVWRLSGMLNAYVASVPAQQRVGKRWFSGSADAIFQSLNLIGDERPDYVVVVGADHVYRMNFDQMLQEHIRTGAGVTVGGVPQPRNLASQFGVIETSSAGDQRVTKFIEKPKKTNVISGDSDEIVASMGNYIFSTQTLINSVREDSSNPKSSHDMGGDIVPSLVSRGDAYLYNLADNEIPGVSSSKPIYWSDVGTIDAFFQAHQDMVVADPGFDLVNPDWPIFSQQWNVPPAKFLHDSRGSASVVEESIVALGSQILGGTIIGSVLGQWVSVGSRASITNSILFDRVIVGAEAEIQRAIIDKECRIGPGVRLGFDRKQDLARGLTLSPGGVTVVPKGTVINL